MNYGFVYCMGNKAMPGIYKMGMTERAPSQRCLELSSSTSAPLPFDLLCYGEVEDPRSVEMAIHQQLASSRVSQGREFFSGSYWDLAALIKEYANSFAETAEGVEEAHREGLQDQFIAADTQEEKALALIAAARFEGVRIWTDGVSICSNKPVDRSTWIGASVQALASVLLVVAPDQEPRSKLSLMCDSITEKGGF